MVNKTAKVVAVPQTPLNFFTNVASRLLSSEFEREPGAD